MRWLILLLLIPLTSFAANIPIKGGCVLGESQLAHGLSEADAQQAMIKYARLYVQNYKSYVDQKRDVLSAARDFLELKGWTQQDIIDFTRQQRELLYISVAGELAVGKISTDELPGYVAAIDDKIREIETELGCGVMPVD
ncbi:MAG: hypothetical protein ACR2QV_09955 [Gammaproteobacteria bacterium]